MAQESPSRKMDQFIVRLPDGMRDRIKAAAEANSRSMNAEIVATLEDAYPAPPTENFALWLSLEKERLKKSREADKLWDLSEKMKGSPEYFDLTQSALLIYRQMDALRDRQAEIFTPEMAVLVENLFSSGSLVSLIEQAPSVED